MMVNANLTLESQKVFWAEAVACSAFIEDLVIKATRTIPALSAWTNTSVTKWVKNLVEFGRVAVVNKREKVSGKMKEKGFPAMMVGYALNHGAGTYRLYNPKTKRIIISRDVKWMDYKPKQLEVEFDVFEPGISSTDSKDDNRSRENDSSDDSSLTSQDSDNTSLDSGENDSDTSEQSSNTTKSTPSKKIDVKIISSSSDSSSTSDENTTTTTAKSRQSKLSKISNPRATPVRRSL